MNYPTYTPPLAFSGAEQVGEQDDDLDEGPPVRQQDTVRPTVEDYAAALDPARLAALRTAADIARRSGATVATWELIECAKWLLNDGPMVQAGPPWQHRTPDEAAAFRERVTARPDDEESGDSPDARD